MTQPIIALTGKSISVNHYRYDKDDECHILSGTANVDFVIKDQTNHIIMQCPSGATACQLSTYVNGNEYTEATGCNAPSVLQEGKCYTYCASNEGL